MKNIFGVEIPTLVDVVTRPTCKDYLSRGLYISLDALGIVVCYRKPIIEEILRLAQEGLPEPVYESKINCLIMNNTTSGNLNLALAERCGRITSPLESYIEEGTTLDYGCGDGRVGEFIHQLQGGVTLADVYHHGHLNSTALPFILLPQFGKAPIASNSFDNIILCGPLHHSDLPMNVLSESIRIVKPGGLLYVFESVYGVNLEFVDKAGVKRGVMEDPFLTLSSKDQLAVDVFFDYFYNRCITYSPLIESKVNMPYNYQPPEDWLNTFHSFGLDVKQVVPLGVDQPLSSLFHMFYVVRKL